MKLNKTIRGHRVCHKIPIYAQIYILEKHSKIHDSKFLLPKKKKKKKFEDGDYLSGTMKILNPLNLQDHQGLDGN